MTQIEYSGLKLLSTEEQVELKSIVDIDDNKLKTLDTYITHAKDQVGQADLEIVFAEKIDNNSNSYSKYIIATLVSVVIIAFKLIG